MTTTPAWIIFPGSFWGVEVLSVFANRPRRVCIIGLFCPCCRSSTGKNHENKNTTDSGADGAGFGRAGFNGPRSGCKRDVGEVLRQMPRCGRQKPEQEGPETRSQGLHGCESPGRVEGRRSLQGHQGRRQGQGRQDRDETGGRTL